MKKITDKTKELLSIAAKKNGLGGVVYVDRVCNQCNIQFKGISNQLRCNVCKNIGYQHECLHCSNQFYNKAKNVKYCSECSNNKSWLVGKKRNPLIGQKISINKLNFYKTDAGKLAAKNIGEKNSIKMKEFNKTEVGILNINNTAKKLSKIMKDKIYNGEFTPNITNSFTHWNAEIILDNLTYKFRSSWEACFWLSNSHLEYEKYRIPYISESGINRIYIADFFDYTNKILYEIKPRSVYVKQQYKMDMIIQYCIDNDIKFIWINENNIMNYIKPFKFNGENYKQLKKMYEGIGYNE